MPGVLKNAAGLTELNDWGPVAEPIGPPSSTRGVLLHRGAEGWPEAGLWECTPGTWRLKVERDEFCHFLRGRCVYTSSSGKRTEFRGGDSAFFPAGWKGACEVIETVRKVYMIR